MADNHALILTKICYMPESKSYLESLLSHDLGPVENWSEDLLKSKYPHPDVLLRLKHVQ